MTQPVGRQEDGVVQILSDDFQSNRTALPCHAPSRANFSLWSFLKECIGKELSKITTPIHFNEPLSFLQRISEIMEYSNLIDLAIQQTDPVKRLEYVTAFAVSASASNRDRLKKPFNPLLGETYEFQEKNYRIVFEQVSHHPPVSAYYAEGDGFKFYGTIWPKLSFWGSTVSAEPKGVVTLELLRHGEIYQWNQISYHVHNVIIGNMWIELKGITHISNVSTGHRVELTWHPNGWLNSSNNEKIEGVLYNSKGDKMRYLYGKWTECIYSAAADTTSGHPSSNSACSPDETEPVGLSMNLHLPDQLLLWRAKPRPENSTQFYNFSDFSFKLNELNAALVNKGVIAPTDSRLRPDMRLMEEGDLDRASAEKERLEEKQRASRKRKECVQPMWFKPGPAFNEVNHIYDWVFTGAYWNRDWSECPHLF